jgi:hypothetical protein
MHLIFELIWMGRLGDGEIQACPQGWRYRVHRSLVEHLTHPALSHPRHCFRSYRVGWVERSVGVAKHRQ